MVNGRNVTALPRRKMPYLRRSIGVVFQSFRLISRKTVFENVTYLPRILGMSRAEQQRMCERALRRVGLAHRLNAYPRQLSGGEQQRVTLARALVCDPRIILADEPTGNLDPELSAEILALLREIHAQGTTVIVATHDRAIIESLGGRVLLLHRGRLVADGYREPGLVEPPPYAAAVAAAVAVAKTAAPVGAGAAAGGAAGAGAAAAVPGTAGDESVPPMTFTADSRRGH